MRRHIETQLGDLTVFTDRRDWKALVGMLVDVAEELDLPLPRALYYGPPDYTKLLSPEDYKDRHLTYRGTTSIMEYWHRDQMVLFFGRMEEQPLERMRALFAHELVHHSDNIECLNITSYALPCIYWCNEDFISVCVDYFKLCMDALRNTSVNSRLPSRYRELCISDILEQARRAMGDAEEAHDDIHRQLARLYAVIQVSSLISFKDKECEAREILEVVISGSTAFKELSSFILRSVKNIFGRKLSINIEESYSRSLKLLICSSMKQIFHQ